MTVAVIAEAGVNHNGSVELGRQLIDVAADAGADYVKFQSFDPDALATGGADKAAYQKSAGASGETQREMLHRVSMSHDQQRQLADHCRSRSLAMLSTPFDLGSLAFVASQLKVPAIKLSSGSLTNGPLLLAAARTDLPVIISTGMAVLDEIAEALDVLAFGFGSQATPAGRSDWLGARQSDAGRAAIEERVTILHCTTAYPAPLEEVNLRVMDTLAGTFGLPVGYSDHTVGTTIAVAAAALGATVIEKHFTLDRTLPGPDHAASLEPGELRAMIKQIRDVGRALGSPDKAPTETERGNAPAVRQSLVALCPIAAGEKFTPENLGVKRPESGLSPMQYWDTIGQSASRDYGTDENI